MQQCLLHPEIFCFADYPCHTVVIDILKAPPEDDNRDISTWKSLNLMETLLRLAEAGHYETVRQLFGYPLKNCPDVLLLALLQTSVSKGLQVLMLCNCEYYTNSSICFTCKN